MSAVADETMWIKLNTGEVVERPYREAVRLVSRRLADPALETDADESGPAEEPATESATEPAANPGPTAALVDSYDKATLVKLAEENDLATSGNKTELVERLLAADVELSADVPATSGATPEDVPGENVSSPDEQD